MAASIPRVDRNSRHHLILPRQQFLLPGLQGLEACFQFLVPGRKAPVLLLQFLDRTGQGRHVFKYTLPALRCLPFGALFLFSGLFKQESPFVSGLFLHGSHVFAIGASPKEQRTGDDNA
jgi:hypothetical protein